MFSFNIINIFKMGAFNFQTKKKITRPYERLNDETSTKIKHY